MREPGATRTRKGAKPAIFAILTASGAGLYILVRTLEPTTPPKITIAWDCQQTPMSNDLALIVESAPAPGGPWRLAATLPYGSGTWTTTRTQAQQFFRVAWKFK